MTPFRTVVFMFIRRCADHVSRITSQKSRPKNYVPKITSRNNDEREKLPSKASHYQANTMKCLQGHALRHALQHAALHAAIHSIQHAVHRSTTHKPVEEPMDLTPRDSGSPVHPGTPGCNNGFVMIGKASSFK